MELSSTLTINKDGFLIGTHVSHFAWIKNLEAAAVQHSTHKLILKLLIK